MSCRHEMRMTARHRCIASIHEPSITPNCHRSIQRGTTDENRIAAIFFPSSPNLIDADAEDDDDDGWTAGQCLLNDGERSSDSGGS